MSPLLDTHVSVWAVSSPAKLGRRARQRLLDPEETLFVSAVSTLEIARLAALGQLELAAPVASWCVIDDAIAVEAYAVPGSFHPEPADRLLVATARIRGYHLVTANRRILGYRQVRTLDARR